MTNASRRLAAIMFTDLVGFTKLGQEDEEEALRLRREHQSLLRPIFAEHRGREVKSLGDGFLVEFPSAVDSVRCAVAIQTSLARRNSTPGVPGRISLRIGIHVGDIVDEDGDILGDAVNVASRIEPLADQGGISLTAAVYQQVRNKVPEPLEKVGARTLKNVRDPVEIYRVVLGERRPPTTPSDAAGEPPGLRLAVLPLANLSSDPSDEFFADGLTDELISRTSQASRLRVIARTSVQRFKGTQKSIREVGDELGVRMALEGSVRKSGNRVRISVQLVDVGTEAPVWSMRYDRPFDDILTIQDDIAGHVAASVVAHLAGASVAPSPPLASASADTTDLEAYSLFLRAKEVFALRGSVESIREALGLFERAVARDPMFARARVGLAEALQWLATEGAVKFEEAEVRAHQELHTALGINNGIAEAHSALAALYLGSDRFEECEREARRAMELNPSLADPYRWLAQIEAGDGRIDEAVRLLDAARRLNPDDLNVLSFYGRALAYSGRTADALAFWESTRARIRFRTNAHLCEYCLSQGDLAGAEEALHEMERVRPDSPWTLLYGGLLAVRRGDPSVARHAIERLEERAKGGEMVVFFIGFLHFGLGEMDAFVSSMEEALQRGVLPMLELVYSPLYAPAREDPRVQDIIRRQRSLRHPAKTPAKG